MKLLQKIALSIMFASMLSTAQGIVELTFHLAGGGMSLATVDEKTSKLNERSVIKNAIQLKQKVHILIRNNMGMQDEGGEITDFSQTIEQLIKHYPKSLEGSRVSFQITGAPSVILEFNWGTSVAVSGNRWRDDHGDTWNQVEYPENTPLNLIGNELISAALKDKDKKIYLTFPDKAQPVEVTDFSHTIAHLMKHHPKALVNYVGGNRYLRFEVVSKATDKYKHEKVKHAAK